MGKNKRKGGLGGLAQFALAAFANTASTPGVEELSTATAEESSVMQQKLEKASISQRYYATGLVPHYEDEADVPEAIQKYFSQRYRMFSLYSEPPGCLLDDEGWFSVTPELIANQIAERCRCDTILDAFCGVGGNAIAFAQTCSRVIALDTSPTRLRLARHNAEIYGVADRIEFILGDYLSFAKSLTDRPQPNQTRRVDVVFLSPPWGGPSYLGAPGGDKDDEEHPCYTLQSILPIPGEELFNVTKKMTNNIAYYLPRNTDLDEISALAPEESIEVEEEWMGSKLKALTCYFGGLAGGQEHLF
ncbi:Tgs1 protein [Coprinopsis sp. MPI-PUGE-AT-0042]|nr:Tgs1 protein [Coprinopsis sp. MPI-PUGE-AT-0042]